MYPEYECWYLTMQWFSSHFFIATSIHVVKNNMFEYSIEIWNINYFKKIHPAVLIDYTFKSSVVVNALAVACTAKILAVIFFVGLM
jgi:hypothetical protein